jgi:hypothetical protein
MPNPPSQAAQRAAETEEDYAKYADKAPTDLQARFADWVLDKTGVTFTTKKEETAYREGIRLAVALRMKFQASPENQAAIVERAERVKAEELEAAKTPAPPRKGSLARTTPPRQPAKAAPAKANKPTKATKAAAAAVEPEPEDEVVAEPVKTTARRRPARRAAQASTTDEAPF